MPLGFDKFNNPTPHPHLLYSPQEASNGDKYTANLEISGLLPSWSDRLPCRPAGPRLAPLKVLLSNKSSFSPKLQIPDRTKINSSSWLIISRSLVLQSVHCSNVVCREKIHCKIT